MTRPLNCLDIIPLTVLLLACGVTGCQNGSTSSTDDKGIAVVDRNAQSASNDPPTARSSISSPRGLDPLDDGWQTEVFAERAGAQLKVVASWLAAGQPINAKDLSSVESRTFLAYLPRRSDFQQRFRDRLIEVRTARTDKRPDCVTRARLADAINEIVGSFSATTLRRVATKIISVKELSRDSVATDVRVSIVGESHDGTIQHNAVWSCQWDEWKSTQPRLTELHVRNVEEVQALQGTRPWFSDCTLAAIGHNASFRSQIQYGMQHWLARIETAHGMSYFSRHGLAVGDANGDGLDDVYLCQPGGLPNRLFLQTTEGTATDRSAEFQVDFLDQTASALFVDMDNDGDQDLALATREGVQLLENDRNLRYVRRTVTAVDDVDLHALSAVDYDNDGYLDLYLTVDYATAKSRADRRLPQFIYHDANDGGANALLHNEMSQADRRWQLTDVTRNVGLGENNQRHSLAAAWEDFDNDGDQDLYVANDYGQNCLYRNDRGRFTDIAQMAGVVDFGSGMSVDWSDYNRDGWIDLYVGNMFSSAGRRITSQAKFLSNVSPSRRLLYRRFAKGNTLFANLGDGTFRESSPRTNTEMGRWSWSSVFSDFNNDGWDDLLVANGYITTDDSGDL